MKKLLIGLLVLGSLSSFGKVHCEHIEEESSKSSAPYGVSLDLVISNDSAGHEYIPLTLKTLNNHVTVNSYIDDDFNNNEDLYLVDQFSKNKLTIVRDDWMEGEVYEFNLKNLTMTLTYTKRSKAWWALPKFEAGVHKYECREI